MSSDCDFPGRSLPKRIVKNELPFESKVLLIRPKPRSDRLVMLTLHIDVMNTSAVSFSKMSKGCYLQSHQTQYHRHEGLEQWKHSAEPTATRTEGRQVLSGSVGKGVCMRSLLPD